MISGPLSIALRDAGIIPNVRQTANYLIWIPYYRTQNKQFQLFKVRPVIGLLANEWPNGQSKLRGKPCFRKDHTRAWI